jgi:hypothetical protein
MAKKPDRPTKGSQDPTSHSEPENLEPKASPPNSLSPAHPSSKEDNKATSGPPQSPDKPIESTKPVATLAVAAKHGVAADPLLQPPNTTQESVASASAPPNSMSQTTPTSPPPAAAMEPSAPAQPSPSAAQPDPLTAAQKDSIKLMMLNAGLRIVGLLLALVIALVGAICVFIAWYNDTIIDKKIDKKTDLASITQLKKEAEDAVDRIKKMEKEISNDRRKPPQLGLLTDFGTGAYYVTNFKGQIISSMSNSSILDITHEIRPYDESSASWILLNSARTFPEGSVFFVMVNPGSWGSPARGRRAS